MSSWYLCQHSLVVWVSVRASAGLAVLWSTSSGVTEEARSTLLTELTVSVVEAALQGDINHSQGSIFLIRMLKFEHGERAVWLYTVQMPVSGWQESEWPLHSQSSQ